MRKVPIVSTAGISAGTDLLAICSKIREVNGALAAHAKHLLQFGLWLSLVERLVRDQEAVGSNPTSPISLERSPRRQAASGFNRTSPIAAVLGVACAACRAEAERRLVLSA